jgi:hypothetical protein
MMVLAPPEPVSPELVLVSPPEVARIARLLLHEPSGPAAAPPRAEAAGPQTVVLASAWLFCLLVTLGPFVLTILVTRAP